MMKCYVMMIISVANAAPADAQNYYAPTKHPPPLPPSPPPPPLNNNSSSVQAPLPPPLNNNSSSVQPPAPPPTKCFKPRSYYLATSTGETVSTAVSGGHFIAVRGSRWLPNDVKMKHTDFGNWSIALGKVGCRTLVMYEGFHAVGVVDASGTIDWKSPMDAWIPEPSWSDKFMKWFWPEVDEDIDAYDADPESPKSYIRDDSIDARMDHLSIFDMAWYTQAYQELVDRYYDEEEYRAFGSDYDYEEYADYYYRN